MYVRALSRTCELCSVYCLFGMLEFNVSVCIWVYTACPVCVLAHFATNYIPPKQLNEQVNEVNST